MTGPEDERDPSVNDIIDSEAGEDSEEGFDESPVEFWDDEGDEEDDEDELEEVYDE